MKNIVKKIIINNEFFSTHNAIPFSLNKKSINNGEIISWNTAARFYPEDMQDSSIRIKYIMDNAKRVGLDDMVMPDQPSMDKLIEACHEITIDEFSSYYESDITKRQGTIWNIDKMYTSIFMTKQTRDAIKAKYNRSVSLVYPAADCAVVRYYDKEKDIIGLTHSDAAKTGNNIIQDMSEYMKNHFNSNLENVEVYVGAFAYDDWIYNNPPKFMYDIDKEGNITGLNKEWNGYIEDLENNKFKIKYGDKIFDQIRNSGISVDNIYFSDDNTLSDKRYFSNARSINQGERQGRNLFGITFDTDEVIKNSIDSGVILK